jgi:hypothetical protein
VLFDKRDPKSAPGRNPYKGPGADSRAKLGKETIAGAHRRPKWVPNYSGQVAQALLRLCSGLLGLARACSGLLRLAQACSGSAPACSPSAQVGSPSAQVKAAAAHVRRLKRNQRKKKLILSLGVSWINFLFLTHRIQLVSFPLLLRR